MHRSHNAQRHVLNVLLIERDVLGCRGFAVCSGVLTWWFHHGLSQSVFRQCLTQLAASLHGTDQECERGMYEPGKAREKECRLAFVRRDIVGFVMGERREIG